MKLISSVLGVLAASLALAPAASAGPPPAYWHLCVNGDCSAYQGGEGQMIIEGLQSADAAICGLHIIASDGSLRLCRPGERGEIVRLAIGSSEVLYAGAYTYPAGSRPECMNGYAEIRFLLTRVEIFSYPDWFDCVQY